MIAQHIDFAALANLVDAFIERGDVRKGGRPAYPTEVMVRVLVLKRLYNLSDEQMEYQLLDRTSYQRFCLLQDTMNVPDRNTIWRFGERIGKDDREKLEEGLQPEWSDAKRRQKDTDATHTKKHGKSYFGYKLSVSVDHKHGFIRGVATGTASEHDGHHFDEVLDQRNTGKEVNADKAYPSAQRKEMLAALGLKDRIILLESVDIQASQMTLATNAIKEAKRAASLS